MVYVNISSKVTLVIHCLYTALLIEVNCTMKEACDTFAIKKIFAIKCKVFVVNICMQLQSFDGITFACKN